MKKSKSFPIILVLVLLIVMCLSVVSARKSYERKNRAQSHPQQKGRSKSRKYAPDPDHFSSSAPAPAPSYGSYEPHKPIFDILSFGAKGDGVSDDSKAFLAAWKAACKAPGATVKLPSDFKFLIKPITLQGPCMPHQTLQIDGTVIAPPSPSAWSKSNLLQWINFKWLHDFTIQGTGTVDGHGSGWWDLSQTQYCTQKRSKHVPDIKPTALRFYASYNVTVRDIRIINSPLCHLKFDNSGLVKVNNITISSPENSPNTDGIHLQNTQDVEIQHSNIGCGDDCVSIQTGCSNIHVHHINCGPGHGISLGSLGKDKSLACVSNVIVENINIENALSGVRIKTWQGGLGSVRNVSFSNIQVSNVQTPIIIDQYYCDKKACKNHTQAVTISQVKYSQITGTYSVQPVHLACSDSVPCTNVDLVDIQLVRSLKSQGFQQPLCWNSYGESQAPLVPSSINCLQRGSLFKRTERSHEHNTC
ncbi:polygalacturonase [Cinnamomum micranthum f. kanehirae]|uniref:Polygalacturonase n=1 Tax=Cinnamomum micranthum f. kanehirae TaxID=337451 RepID=A0A443PTF3_9MAGN|nr:polygalacturonase [Cinnamomum micranthum f. kanehirae]